MYPLRLTTWNPLKTMPNLHPNSKKVNLIVLGYIVVNIFVFVLIGWIIFSEISNQTLEISVFDIGQGDSILIRTPKQEYILVDGGPDNSVMYKLGKILPFYTRTIDYVILTHTDADHLVGLIEVLKRYQVKYVITTEFVAQSAPFKEWQKIIASHSVLIIDEPKILDLGETDIYFIHPFSPDLGKVSNNAGIVFKLEYKNSSALFMADFEDEEAFVDSPFNVKADWLKVGHHGADNANDYAFLAQVSPALAVISVGRNNKFGHPRPATLANLEKVGARIFRTDLIGDLVFIPTAQGWQYRP